MSSKLKVMISSTARDLPEHRQEVLDACLRQGMFPVMMEHLPASDAEAISVSLKLVDEADIYIGIIAHRYGYVPKENNPQQISITEMEYDRAVERKIPRLIFLIDKTHPLTIDDVEQGEGAVKLGKLKSSLEVERVVNFFKSPADLRAHVINSLSQLREPDLEKFHYISDIPVPPKAFIAHPYTLLETHNLIGRQPELSLLTDWVAKPDSEICQTRILNIVAIGGMGKSALTWKWFNDIAPQEMNPLAGSMWWSFYESDATFENFLTRALAYVSRRPLEEVQKIPAPERETQLLFALDQEPFLIVLDGLERITIAYARADAARLKDSEVENQGNLRKTADPRAGRFLRKLAQIGNSRILISTRLYPDELETNGGDPIPNCSRIELTGLTDEDAVELWRAFDVSGARDLLLPLFATFDKHPLLIQALAGEVKRYRRAPGDFEKWREANPRFDPTEFPHLQDAMAHVMDFALLGLDDKTLPPLQIIAAFRMPAQYDTLAALLIGENKPCADDDELDGVLTELEDRGLIGWDKQANRYDLHPIVRGVVWSKLGDDTRRGVYTTMQEHFEALPPIPDYTKVNSLEDLTTGIELYNTLIGLGRYDDALTVFHQRLDEATLYRLNSSLQRIELIEMLFPDGLDKLPRMNDPSDQAYALNVLALSYKLCGQPDRAIQFYRRGMQIRSELNDTSNLTIGLKNLSSVNIILGNLYESENNSRQALTIVREEGSLFDEMTSLNWLGVAFATHGEVNASLKALRRALNIVPDHGTIQWNGYVSGKMAKLFLWTGNIKDAALFADRAFEYSQIPFIYETGYIEAIRLRGEAALKSGDFPTADEHLHRTLTLSRRANLLEEELSALIGLADLRRQQGDIPAAREFLDDIWEMAERGPYPLFHADACNILAQIERDKGNPTEAVKAATKAFELAWCDGPPFAYHWGLINARKQLLELGAPEPVMPPFDVSKFEPMPEVEIDPEDEFHAGNIKDDFI